MSGEFFQTKKFKVAALALGNALNSIIVIIVGMIMARVLERTEVAAYQQTLLAYMTVAPFLALGVGNGIFYFLPSEKERIRGRIVDSICVLSVMGFVFSLFILFGGNQSLAQRFDNPRVAELLLWMIPYSIFMVPASHHAAVLVAQNRAVLSASYSTGIQLIVGISTIIPLLLWKDEKYALVGNVIAACITAVCSIVLMVRVSPKGRAAPSLAAMKELVRYSFPLGLATMVATISLNLDKILVGSLLGPEEFAVYSFGAREIPLIGLFVGSLSSVIMVQMREDVVNDNHKAAANEFRRCSELTAPLLFPVAAFFAVNAQQFIELLFTAQYSDAAIPFAIYSLTVLVRSASFGAILGAYGQNWFIFTRTIVGLLANLILSIIAIQLIGSAGAAWATVFVLFFIATPLNYSKITKISGVTLGALVPFRLFGKITLISLIFTCLQICSIHTIDSYAIWFNLILLGCIVTLTNWSFIRTLFERGVRT